MVPVIEGQESLGVCRMCGCVLEQKPHGLDTTEISTREGPMLHPSAVKQCQVVYT